MTDTELVRAIEARYVAVCRELVRAEGAYSDRLAFEALEIAVGEHAGDLRRHPEIAALHAADLDRLTPEAAETPERLVCRPSAAVKGQQATSGRRKT